MKESTLLKISLACSLAGVFIIILISERIGIEESDIGSILDSSVDEKVRIRGEITSIRETPGLFILTIKDNSATIKVVVFKEEDLNLEKGDNVEITGLVKKFEEELEIEADLIKLF